MKKLVTYFKQVFCGHPETEFIKLHRQFKKVEYRCKKCKKTLIVDWLGEDAIL